MNQILVRDRTLKPDPNQSLFKYKLHWLPTTNPQATQPKILYSFDRQSERNLFRTGLSHLLRTRWTTFLGNLPDDAYSFFGLAYPVLLSQSPDGGFNIEVYFDGNPVNADKLKALIEAYKDNKLIGSCANDVGLNIKKTTPVLSKDAPRIGYSPRYHKDIEAIKNGGTISLNGLCAVKKWFDTNLDQSTLIKIEVFDNICYHQDNYICTWQYRSVPQSSPIVERGQMQTIGSVISQLIPNH